MGDQSPKDKGPIILGPLSIRIRLGQEPLVGQLPLQSPSYHPDLSGGGFTTPLWFSGIELYSTQALANIPFAFSVSPSV